MRRQEIVVVTDSVANIPKNLIEKFKIEVLPLYFRYGNKTFRDGIDITMEEVYKRIEEGEIPTSTSQISAGDFINVYQKLLKNHKSIISIHLTSKLSGTYSSALLAANLVSPLKIKVFNSESVLMAEGFQVLEAARAARAGESLEDILNKLRYLKYRIKSYFTIDTFKFVQKIGRVPNIQALIATKLNIKPIFTFREGNISLVKLTRSRKKALNELKNRLFTDFGENIKLRIAIMHAMAKGEAIGIRNILLEKFNCLEMIIVDANPIIGAFGGPGLMGVVACPTEISSEILKY